MRNAVSPRLFSAAMACRTASGRKLSIGITAAGFPASGRVGKASIWNMGVRTEELLISVWTGTHCSPSNYARAGGNLYNQSVRLYCYTEDELWPTLTAELLRVFVQPSSAERGNLE